ncbi:MAG: hypothetical protein E7466_06885 [Ruminococcaceae bacterium]|nr:hypothetical protein [Oscillospiraceae bacterium]
MTEKNGRKRINLDLVILAVVAVVVLVLYLCSVLINPLLIRSIDADDVEKVVIYGRQMDDDKKEEFIELYNSSKYAGRYKDDAGSTPNFSVKVHFTNGDKITIWDDGSRLFVSPESGETFQIRNKELYAFLID